MAKRKKQVAKSNPEYDNWRASEVKRIGLHEQLAAESVLEKEQSKYKNPVNMKIREIETGIEREIERGLGQSFIKKGKAEKVYKYFTVPSIPGFTDK